MVRILAVALAALAVVSPQAKADHYLQTADPQVVQTIQEIVGALGQGCNAGNAGACQSLPSFQQQAHFMLSAGYDCRASNDPQACQTYQAFLPQLQQAYQQVSYLWQSGQLMQPSGFAGGGGAGMGLTHAQRMQQIHDMGRQSTQNWRQNQQIMDNRHEQFMQTLRE
ncbi:hypothetical protein N9W17_01005 [Jannaschia sp.]|nr:hypothetical protein [Jannaschia sp.]